MNNFDLVYNEIKPINCRYKNKPIYISVKNTNFNSDSLKYIAARIKGLLKYRYLKYYVVLDLGDIIFSDKITCLLLDRFIYDLVTKTNFKTFVNINIDMSRVKNHCYLSSALYRSKGITSEINNEKFKEEYLRKRYSTLKIYRRLISRDEFTNVETLSIIYSEVAFVLKQNFEDEEWINDVSEVIVELITNVETHTDSDCIVDIFISDGYFENDDEKKSYQFLDIGVMNFSENRLFDLVANNIIKKKYPEEDEIYRKIYEAYENHRLLFDDYYQENDFFMITTFQKHVSSRSTENITGGTGLPTLIENIVSKSRTAYSYVLSGDNILFLDPKSIWTDSNGFLNFSKGKEFMTDKVEVGVVDKTKIYIPGTIYYLLFVKE